MKALTLTAPWGTLSVARLVGAITRGTSTIPAGRPPKRHETRGWRIDAATLPLRLALHAGKGDAGLRDAVVRQGRFVERYATPLIRCGYETWDPWARGPAATAHPRGPLKPVPLAAIVGVVTITEIVRTERWAELLSTGQSDELDYELGNWEPGRWAWRMEDAVALERPLRCRGAQGLWDVPDDVQAEIDAQLGTVAA